VIIYFNNILKLYKIYREDIFHLLNKFKKEEEERKKERRRGTDTEIGS
jgi:hypothetical protein